mgnify:CR=1 FL=1
MKSAGLTRTRKPVKAALLFGTTIVTTVAFLTSPPHANASYRACRSDLRDNPVKARAIDFLRGISGRYSLGTCQIELHVCEEYSDASDNGTSVGDLLVIDRFGHESYIQLDFGNGDSNRSRVSIQNGRIMFHYEFDDRHQDPVAGRTESIRLEILKTSDLTRIRSLHAGVYTTHDWIARGREFTYYWSICEGEGG